jgi:hypothetical protein
LKPARPAVCFPTRNQSKVPSFCQRRCATHIPRRQAKGSGSPARALRRYYVPGTITIRLGSLIVAVDGTSRGDRRRVHPPSESTALRHPSWNIAVIWKFIAQLPWLSVPCLAARRRAGALLWWPFAISFAQTKTASPAKERRLLHLRFTVIPTVSRRPSGC